MLYNLKMSLPVWQTKQEVRLISDVAIGQRAGISVSERQRTAARCHLADVDGKFSGYLSDIIVLW